MTDILATTTSILDLLVPHEASERVRVLSAVRAVLDLSEDWGGLESVVVNNTWGPAQPVVVSGRQHGKTAAMEEWKAEAAKSSKPAKEKPPTAAPKARNQPSPERVGWKKLVPIFLSQRPMSPAKLREVLGIPFHKRSTLSAVLLELASEGVVKATGTRSNRVYSLAP